jgi:hypothetical protein
MNGTSVNNPPCFALNLLSLYLHIVPMGSVLRLAVGEGRNSAFLAANEGVALDPQVGDLTTFDLGKNNWHRVISIFVHLPESLRQDVHRCDIDSMAKGEMFHLEAYTVAPIGRGAGGPHPNVDGVVAGVSVNVWNASKKRDKCRSYCIRLLWQHRMT